MLPSPGNYAVCFCVRPVCMRGSSEYAYRALILTAWVVLRMTNSGYLVHSWVDQMQRFRKALEINTFGYVVVNVGGKEPHRSVL